MTAAVRAENQPKSGVEQSDTTARKPLRTRGILKRGGIPTVGRGGGKGKTALTRRLVLEESGSSPRKGTRDYDCGFSSKKVRACVRKHHHPSLGTDGSGEELRMVPSEAAFGRRRAGSRFRATDGRAFH